jgi:hypothetical protein
MISRDIDHAAAIRNDRSSDLLWRDKYLLLCLHVKRKRGYFATITMFLPEFFAEYKASSAL